MQPKLNKAGRVGYSQFALLLSVVLYVEGISKKIRRRWFIVGCVNRKEECTKNWWNHRNSLFASNTLNFRYVIVLRLLNIQNLINIQTCRQCSEIHNILLYIPSTPSFFFSILFSNLVNVSVFSILFSNLVNVSDFPIFPSDLVNVWIPKKFEPEKSPVRTGKKNPWCKYYTIWNCNTNNQIVE